MLRMDVFVVADMPPLVPVPVLSHIAPPSHRNTICEWRGATNFFGLILAAKPFKGQPGRIDMENSYQDPETRLSGRNSPPPSTLPLLHEITARHCLSRNN